ncbi:MAG: TetR/AcrR family transcriptional regulator [Acidobacteria bacterium]|nr:TetR/AcrR family transcriptional regulator [Acidobacteriota bacterium]MCZ6456994.1 TetR/AcrR family transcriptional regulator [Actinomycetota bacterium]MCZ6505769.1 TetR/AcrR family transcriptional regulator [Actinomycetota bacterium]
MTKTKEIDPRIERTRRVVLDAAAELVGECGFGRASIEAISERSGVARSTIYRHWPERSELLVEAVGKRVGPVTAIDSGDLRTDLLQVFSHLGNLLSSEPTKSVAASFIAEAIRDPELAALHAKFTEKRRATSITLIERAISRGDLPKTTDPSAMADDLAAPVFFRALILHQPIETTWIESHVDRWIEIYQST